MKKLIRREGAFMVSDGAKREKILVTSALPYANGPIHFGHISGAYLPADIFVRYKKMCGADIIYICGTDDHGVAITISAEAARRTPEEHVRINHDLIKSIFDKFNIDFTNFSQTSRKVNHEISQEFFTRLNDKGLIEKKETEQFYCEKCKRFLADRYITGECPHCGHKEARGDECGGCGAWLEPFDLKNPRCKVCGGGPERRKTVHWYLKLGDRAEWLSNWIAEKEEGKDGMPWKKFIVAEVQGYLKRGLQSRAITRDLDWGVRVPLAEAEGKVLYVWFDAPIGYISSTKEYFASLGDAGKWTDYWKNPQCKLYHFIGKDNIPFHAMIFPIMLDGMEQDYKLADYVAANAFLNLEGRQ
ncbi:MAG TPA: methionine--tRNA ligase, partial [bacterium]|nr:methionine--tRNA ligase [bacterium]